MAQKPTLLKLGVNDTTLSDIENIGTFTYFKVRQGAYYQLWKTDGTQSGTTLVKDSFVSEISNLVTLNGTLFFMGPNAAGKPCLYKSTGTRAGTLIVKTFTTDSAVLFGLSVINNTGYFSYTHSNPSYSGIWKTDGTDAGTLEIKSGILCKKAFRGQAFLPAGNTIVFFVKSATLEYSDLWKTDGTNGGTTMVKEKVLNYAISKIGNYANTGTYGIFTDESGASNLWRTDGTLAGTFVLRGGYIGNFALYNSEVYFLSGTIYKSLNKTNGTNLISVTGLSNVGNSLGVLNNLLFMGGEADNDWEPHAGDGTLAGNTYLRNIRAGTEAGGSDPRYYTAVGNTMYFVANDYIHNDQIYKSNGTPSGTMLAYALGDTIPRFSTMGLSAGAGFLLFVDKGNTLYTLYTSGGTGMADEMKATVQYAFPNPSEGVIQIDPMISAQAKIQLFNMLGEEAQIFVSDHTINLMHLPKGVYVLNITEGTSTYTQKVVLQ